MITDLNEPLVTPEDVRVNASHLNTRVAPLEALEMIIQEVHVLFIYKYLQKWRNIDLKVQQLTAIERYLAQHTATLNVRRADSESMAGLSKSMSVPKDMDLDQTEYGQMARRFGKMLGMDWAMGNPAVLEIY